MNKQDTKILLFYIVFMLLAMTTSMMLDYKQVEIVKDYRR